MRRILCIIAALTFGSWVGIVHARSKVQIPSSIIAGTLQAELYLPADAVTGVVVALHGCGGLYRADKDGIGIPAARHDVMGQLLSKAGYAAVFPDSLGSRGLGSICRQGTNRVLDEAQRATDARDTVRWVQSQPWGSNTRIVLLGWSHGGSTVLEAVDARSPSMDVVLAVAFYPGCSKARANGYSKTSVPLVMYLGALDDWTDPRTCEALGRLVGADVEVYADSYHGFDEPHMPLREMDNIPRAQGTVRVHQGTNLKAREAAYAHLFRRLGQALKP